MSMTYLARDIAGRLHLSPAYICPQHSDVAADLREIARSDLAALKSSFSARTEEILSSYGYSDSLPSADKPFAYADGVAIIPIHGLLINRLSWSYSFATGYNFIRSQRQAALADPDVKLIVYDVNSPGGVASGCKELCDEMYESRGEKPSLAVVDARCYSAAYFLACACDRIVVTPSGGVGSIGCFVMHVDYSKMLEAEGLAVTFIEEPEDGLKTDGNPYKPLSARARASIQRDVAYHYGLFVSAVARNRDMSEDDVRATQAGCFLPPEALDNGLIDGVETPAEAVANFYNEITSDADAGDDEMTIQPQPGTPASAGTVSPPAVAAPSLSAEEIGKIAAKAAIDAVTADRARGSQIRTCDEAKGREALADHLATNTEMSVEAAKAVLAASPKAAEAHTQQPPSAFGAAMDRTQNPNIQADAGSGGPAGDDQDTPAARATRILGAYGKASGKVIDLKPAA